MPKIRYTGAELPFYLPELLTPQHTCNWYVSWARDCGNILIFHENRRRFVQDFHLSEFKPAGLDRVQQLGSIYLRVFSAEFEQFRICYRLRDFGRFRRCRRRRGRSWGWNTWNFFIFLDIFLRFYSKIIVTFSNCRQITIIFTFCRAERQNTRLLYTHCQNLEQIWNCRAENL